jgi:hypothetical protein
MPHACPFAPVLIEPGSSIETQNAENRQKNTANSAKNGIEPDDMVGPVGFEPSNIVGSGFSAHT